MITFKQLCEYLTNNQRYSWFYFDSNLLSHLSSQETDDVYIENKAGEEIIRIWYPKIKWEQQQVKQIEFRKDEKKRSSFDSGEMGILQAKMFAALCSQNIEEANKIQQQMKELQNENS